MPRKSSLAAAAALITAAMAVPAEAADTPARVVRPPDRAALIAARAALGKAGPEAGRAVARCRVSAAGAVSGCSIVREYPTAAGLGDLLLATAAKYEVAPALHDGKPTDSEVLIEQDTFRADQPGDWLKKPTPDELLAVYPHEALGRGLGGEATISCLVSTQGALFDCYVTSEAPAGQNFGFAALALTPQFLMRPATLKGQPVL
jgi:hypothetical protein